MTPIWFRLPSLQSILSGMTITFIRFSLPLVFAMGFTFMGLAETHNFKPFTNDKDLWVQFQTLSSLGFFLLFSARIISERQNGSLAVHLILAGAGVGLLSLIIFQHPIQWRQYRFLGTGVASFIFVAPFLNRKNDNDYFWNFNAKLIVSAVHAIFSFMVLAAGLSAALSGIDYMFSVEIDGKVYSDIWMVCAGLIGPWIFLAGIPQEFDKNDPGSFPQKCNAFVTFILAPLVALYVVILYAYIVKILIQWELPRGQVAYLVISYSSIGVLTHLLAFRVKETGNRGAEIFVRFFYPSLIPPIVLLVVGITERTSTYGVTESRYAVILLTLWLAFTALYFSFSKDKQFKIIPLQLSLLFLLTSFGPWGAEAVSQRSQVTRLERLLAKNNLLVEGKIVKATLPVPNKDSKEVRSILQYVVSSHKKDAIDPWFIDFSGDFKSDAKAKDYIQAIGLTQNSPCGENEWFHLRSEEPKYWNVSGYDFISSNIRTGRIHEGKKWENSLSFGEEGLTTKIILKLGSRYLTLTNDQNEEVSFDVRQLTDELLLACENKFAQEKMTLEGSSKSLNARINFSKIAGRLKKEGIEYTDLTFSILFGATLDQPAAAN